MSRFCETIYVSNRIQSVSRRNSFAAMLFKQIDWQRWLSGLAGEA